MDTRLKALAKESIEYVVLLHRDEIEAEVDHWCYHAETSCASEIEKLFLLAYRVIGVRREFSDGGVRCYHLEIFAESNDASINDRVIPFDAVREPAYFASRFADFCKKHHGFSTVDFMWIQPQIERYRADFVVCRAAYGLGDEDEIGWPELVEVTSPVVIECDGHAYHERTKQQASHDRERDRVMQAKGYRVMRFTGSELHRDPLKCAGEVDDFLASPQARAKSFRLALL